MMPTYNMEDYEKTYHAFRYEVPEYFNFAGDVIDKWARDRDRLAMWWVDDAGHEVKQTFHDVSLASRRLANALAARGVRQGDMVLLILPRSIAWWVAVTACIRMGAVVCPGTTQLTPKDLAFRANKSEATCILANPEVAEKFDKVADECPSVTARIVIGQPRDGWLLCEEIVSAASDVFETARTRSRDGCIVYFSSGATGFPKMALHKIGRASCRERV